MREFRFTFICDRDERRTIDTIASRLSRTRSDAIRFLLNKAAREMNINLFDGVQISHSEKKVTHKTK